MKIRPLYDRIIVRRVAEEENRGLADATARPVGGDRLADSLPGSG